MKRTSLMSEKFLEKQLNNMGADLFERTYISDSRMSGKSTRLALNAIGLAIYDPGREIKIKDHHEGIGADCHLLNLVNDIIEDLHLEGFEINRARRTIKFNLYETHPRDILKRLRKQGK